MGLIEICLFALVVPQGPAAGVTPAQPPRAQLAQLEAAGEYADAAALTSLALHEDEAIAARAAWLLANSRNPSHVEALPRVAAESPHAAARLHGLHGLLQRRDPSSTTTALRALEDPDRAVRTVAANLLGALQRPTAIEPLLRVVHAAATRGGDQDATDARAALVALADLGASQHLLRMATALDRTDAPACGEALAYAFQELSPQLDARRETTALIAVLGHRAPLLRRYAITRLTELNAPRSLAALEARLTREDAQLLPLIEVAIQQLRGGGAASQGELERATADAEAFGARALEWWSSRRTPDKVALCVIPTALLVGLWLIRRALRDRAHLAEGEAAAALASHSDEYYAEHEHDDEADYDYDEAYEDADVHDEEQLAGAPEEAVPSLWDDAAADEQPTADDARLS